MKILIAAIVGLLVMTAQPAAAQWRHNGGRHFEVQGQRQGPGRGDFGRGDYGRGEPQRQQPQREYRQPEYRQPERQMERRPDGRLTDEERRNLRRDLDRANREIYKGR
jgi:hypothetical protein